MESQFTETIRSSLGFLYEPLKEVFLGVWVSFFQATTSRLHWLYIGTTLITVFIIYLLKRSKDQPGSVRDFFRFCLPKSIYAHKSAIVDYKFYISNNILARFISFGTIIISATLIGGYTTQLLEFIVGPVRNQSEAGPIARFVYTLAIVLAVDIGFFIAHYIEHKVPFFWEFHKVHHSSAVLTPVSGRRFHPMDLILQGTLITFFVAMTNALFGYFYSNGLSPITILNCSIVLFAYNLTANLRHSHIWLPYGWKLSHFLSSPAMHQIHHSTEQRHLDKNLALVFSFLDYLAGTIYIPKQKEDFKVGLKNDEHEEYSSIWRLYFLPIKKSLYLLLNVNGVKS